MVGKDGSDSKRGRLAVTIVEDDDDRDEPQAIDPGEGWLSSGTVAGVATGLVLSKQKIRVSRDNPAAGVAAGLILSARVIANGEQSCAHTVGEEVSWARMLGARANDFSVGVIEAFGVQLVRRRRSAVTYASCALMWLICSASAWLGLCLWPVWAVRSGCWRLKERARAGLSCALLDMLKVRSEEDTSGEQCAKLFTDAVISNSPAVCCVVGPAASESGFQVLTGEDLRSYVEVVVAN